MASEPRDQIRRLCQQLAIVRGDLDRIRTVKSELEQKQDGIERALFDAIEAAGLRSVKHPELGNFGLNDLAWAHVTDEGAVRKWCEENMPELLSPNRTRLATIVREFIRGERADMPDGVEPTFSRKINWRKS